MLRTIGILFFTFLLLSPASAAPQFAFRITFRDKAGAPQLSANPSWLSTRAMSRRANFGIALDSTDRPVSPLYLDSVLALSNGRLHNTSRWLNQCVILVTDSTPIAAIRIKPWVKTAELVGYFPAGLHNKQGRPDTNPKSESIVSLPPSGATLRQNGSAAYYGAAYNQTAMVHGDTLHDQGFRGKGKLIAVLDEGFTDVNTHRGFDSLRTQGRLLETYNFVLDTSFVYSYGTHGTSCLSTMAGLIPNSFVGTAPEAEFALYVTEDGNFTDALYELDNLVAGIERADSIGADVIAASLGYNTFDSPYITSFSKNELNGATTSVARAVNIAAAKGILYVASAGNEGNNNWNYLVSPADADSALTVGAVTPLRSPASFSSPGPNAAGRVKPDVCLQGDPAALFGFGNSIGASSGTSFAAPQAAGYAACLMQAFPTLPPAFIRQAFAHIAHLYPDSTPKLGYGIPDFRLAQRYLAQFYPDGEPDLFYVRPNPFNTSFKVVLPRISSVTEMALHDMLGRSVRFQQTRVSNTITVTPSGALHTGIYILTVIADGKRYVQKLMHD